MTLSHIGKIATLVAVTGTASAQTAEPPTPPGAVYHYARAHEIAANDPYLLKWIDQGVLCRSPEVHNRMMNAARAPGNVHPAQPVQLFDNLWMFGTSYVNTLVLKTSVGLVMIDTLNTPDEARTITEAQMPKMGLNPADLKYVLVTHGHGDHWGGAAYWQSKYHVPAGMLAEDWDMTYATTNPKWAALPKPVRDQVLTDGQDLTFGDTVIHIVKTPGHTPGVASAVFPVRDKGAVHYLDMWGGTAYGNMLQQHESLHKLWAAGKKYHADGMINTHAFVNFVDDLIAAKAGAKVNPIILGEAELDRLFAVQDECAEAYMSWQAVEKPAAAAP